MFVLGNDMFFTRDFFHKRILYFCETGLLNNESKCEELFWGIFKLEMLLFFKLSACTAIDTYIEKKGFHRNCLKTLNDGIYRMWARFHLEPLYQCDFSVKTCEIQAGRNILIRLKKMRKFT